MQPRCFTLSAARHSFHRVLCVWFLSTSSHLWCEFPLEMRAPTFSNNNIRCSHRRNHLAMLCNGPTKYHQMCVYNNLNWWQPSSSCEDYLGIRKYSTTAFRWGHSFFNPIDTANSGKNRSSLAKRKTITWIVQQIVSITSLFDFIRGKRLLSFRFFSNLNVQVAAAASRWRWPFLAMEKNSQPNQQLMWIFLCCKEKVCTLLWFSRQNTSYDNWSDSISFKITS